MPPEAAVAPAAGAAPAAPLEPKATVIDPTAAGGAAPAKPAAGAEPVVDAPFEFELDVKGQKQKINFQDKARLTAVLQKALYADQVIKDAAQAKKGAEAFMLKLKEPGGLKEILSDPAIAVDYKKWALEQVREMMEEEKLTPEQKELRDLQNYKKGKEEEVTRAKAEAAAKDQRDKLMKDAAVARGSIIESMKKFPDIPQTQATMDAVIQNMRAGFRRFGKHLTPDQAMTVYSQQYWTSLAKTMETMTPEQMLVRFGQKNLDKIQKFKLDELRKRSQPGYKPPVAGDVPAKPKKHMTEKEFDKHFQTLAGGL
jgi:hypothetical protein